MFGISITEIAIVLVIGFIVVGPKKMTELAYEAGKWFSKIKSQIQYFKEIQLNPFDGTSVYEPIIENNKDVVKTGVVDINDTDDKKETDPKLKAIESKDASQSKTDSDLK